MNSAAASPVRLGVSDIESASHTLARAFENDPFFRQLFPHPATRQQDTVRSLRCLLRFAVCHGEVYATSSGMEGVALWAPPEMTRVGSLWHFIETGAIWLPLTVGVRFMRRIMAYLRHTERHWARLAPEPHWYLQVLGVAPEHQGHGYSRRLMEGQLQRIAEAGLPCCLDTENPKNLSFYEHLGFRRLEETVIPGIEGPVRCWLFRRDPA
jgi:GNAT superfamily N-acetyltransferase